MDESDLKQKLQTSTGKPITEKGKKLLKRYHQHLEQENLVSVQGKQLEGDLRQAYILLKQTDTPSKDKDSPDKVKELHKKWNKEFSDQWKDLSAKHNDDKDKIKGELFKNHPKLNDKLDKVQTAKANWSLLAAEQKLTQAQKSSSMLKDSDLKGADQAAKVQAEILGKSAKSSKSKESSKTEKQAGHLEFWGQKTSKDAIMTLTPKEKLSLQATDKNLDTIKKQIIKTIEAYRDDPSSSLSKRRKEGVKQLIEEINKAGSIGDIYQTAKTEQSAQIKGDLENNNMFLNKKGSRYQNVLDNVLDKIVATNGITYNATEAKKEVSNLVGTVPVSNKVAKDIKPLLELKGKSLSDHEAEIRLIKGCLVQNMKNYNNTDKILAQNIINKITRVDLKKTQADNIEKPKVRAIQKVKRTRTM